MERDLRRDLELYYLLKLTREFEHRVARLHAQNKVLGGVYSGYGQEAAVVGCTHGLRREDFLFPLHRDLGAFLVKGVPPRNLMAQLFGKRTGLSRGKDSFLHGGDLEHGVFGATSMLASTLPVACGVALKFKLSRQPLVAVAFLGEGASSRGDFHEALNFAGVHRLPVVFVCENNRWAYSTPLELQMAVETVAERAPAYGFKGHVCNGNDLQEVLDVAGRAVALAREGGGPTLIECRTYRVLGHSAHDRAAYRGEGEVKQWESRDPIRQWEAWLELAGLELAKVREETDGRVREVIEDAVRFAEASPDPDPDEVLEDLYATPCPGVPPQRAPRAAEPSEQGAPGPESPALH